MTSLRVALGLLTVVPGAVTEPTTTALRRSVVWFPLIGAGVGALAGSMAWLAGVWYSPLVAGMAGVTSSVLATGALHEDGLADTVDAFGGRGSPARRLEIMKDPRVGVFGVIAIVVSIMLRVALIATVPHDQVGQVLIGTHALARSAPLFVLVSGVEPAGEGLGRAFLGQPQRSTAFAGMVVAVVIGTAAIGVRCPILLAAIGTASVVIAHGSRKLVGGVTGDVMGAAEQVAEGLVLLAL